MCDHEIAAILPNMTSCAVCAFPCRPQVRPPQLPFPIALQQGQTLAQMLPASRSGPQAALWNAAALVQSTATGNLVQKALQLTAQIAKQNQLKSVPIPITQPSRATFAPILPLPVVEGDSEATAKLKEQLPSKTSGAPPQSVETAPSPQLVEFVSSPQRVEGVPSPQPLKEKHRMGSDDLLADENIEKMEKSYSDDESEICLDLNLQRMLQRTSGGKLWLL